MLIQISWLSNFPAAVLITALLIGGCTTLHNAGVPGLDIYVREDPKAIAFEKEQREKFMVDRDHKAFYWLLSHQIANGMTLHEVEEILGGAGEYISDIDYSKTTGSHQLTDVAYKWGPDNKGRSVIIFFRENHVSNYEQKDYSSP